MQALLLSIHHRLLPQRKNLGYMPYVWLAYLGIYYFNFWFVPLGSNNEFKLILAHIGLIRACYCFTFLRFGR